MAGTSLDQRRFDDDEIRRILETAVKQASARALGSGEGLTLAELKEVGREVGIPPERLEEAARALVVRREEGPVRLLGGPLVLRVERRVEGGFAPGDTPEVLSVIRRAMGHQGQVQERHGSLEWSEKGDVGDRYVSLSPRDGGTAIEGAANLSNAAVLTYVPAGSLGLIGSLVGLIKFVQDGSQVGLVVFLALLPLLYGVLRGVFRHIARAEERRLHEAVDELARLADRDSG